jgi:hypothetical protein
LEQLPVVALHPGVIADNRVQVEKLNAAPAADSDKGVSMEVTGSLNTMLMLATGKAVTTNYSVSAGAGEENRIARLNT